MTYNPVADWILVAHPIRSASCHIERVRSLQTRVPLSFLLISPWVSLSGILRGGNFELCPLYESSDKFLFLEFSQVVIVSSAHYLNSLNVFFRIILLF